MRCSLRLEGKNQGVMSYRNSRISAVSYEDICSHPREESEEVTLFAENIAPERRK